MRWISPMRRIAAVSTVAAALAVPAQADEAADLLLTAVGYAEIPDGSAFRVQTVDDTALNQHVARQVADALRARNYEVRDDAPFVVAIRMETAWSDPPERASLGKIDIGSGLGLAVMVNLWSTTADSLLRRQPDAALPDRDHRLRLSVYRFDDGRYVWHGEVADLRDGQDLFLASRTLVPTLIDSLGTTVPSRKISLHPQPADRITRRGEALALTADSLIAFPNLQPHPNLEVALDEPDSRTGAGAEPPVDGIPPLRISSIDAPVPDRPRDSRRFR